MAINRAGDERQSSTVGVVSTSPSNYNPPSSAPQNASAAPQGGATKQFQGLAEALNQIQLEYKKEGKLDIPDVYEIVFADGMGECDLSKEGVTTYGKTPMPPANTAGEKLLPEKNSINTIGRTVPVTAGTQIIQFINQIVATSSYITEQQTQYWDEQTQELKPNATANGPFKWFKVNLNAVPIEYDKLRKDFAYKMTYMIAPYEINQMESPYFNDSKFRGVHKVYDYWFTGNNTQVLEFSQSFDNLYQVTVSGSLIKNRTEFTLPVETSEQTPVKKTIATASNQSVQQADGKTNEPASNAMEYLFSPNDQTEVTIKVIGDPAWLQQGELTGLNLQNLSKSAFLPDGTINVDISQVVFSINWNQLSDYNLETGLMDVYRTNLDSKVQPQEALAYRATEVTSTFSKGRFEQEIKGTLITNLQENALASVFPTVDRVRQQSAENTLSDTSPGSRNPINSLPSNPITTSVDKIPATARTTDVERNTIDTPASAALPSTSNGSIEYASGDEIRRLVADGGVVDPSRTNQTMVKEA